MRTRLVIKGDESHVVGELSENEGYGLQPGDVIEVPLSGIVAGPIFVQHTNGAPVTGVFRITGKQFKLNGPKYQPDLWLNVERVDSAGAREVTKKSEQETRGGQDDCG